MNAKEIQSLDFAKSCDELTGARVDRAAVSVLVWQATLLREIAYQLAVLNERLADEKKSINVALCATNDDIPVRIKS